MNLLIPWKAREVVRGLAAVLRYFRSSLSNVAYAGTYEVVGDEVAHHVDLSLIPGWGGNDQQRGDVRQNMSGSHTTCLTRDR